jgi:cytochrome c biogenesis protein CcdA
MILLLLSFIAGILTVLAPCVLPLLPVIVGGSLSGGKSIVRAVTVTISLALSVIIFTLLIKGSTLLIDIPADFWKWVSGGIIIVFGLISLFPKIWDKVTWFSSVNTSGNRLIATGYKKQNRIGDILVGAALGPVFSTCSPTYFLVLAAVLPSNFFLGLVYLIAYSLGLSLALLVVAFVGQTIVEKMGIVSDPNGWFKRGLGVLFIIVGIAIIGDAQ